MDLLIGSAVQQHKHSDERPRRKENDPLRQSDLVCPFLHFSLHQGVTCGQ